VREFSFDARAYVAIRVFAETEEEAMKMLLDNVHIADSNLGAWPNGDPIMAEVTIEQGDVDLIEVDGEPV